MNKADFFVAVLCAKIQGKAANPQAYEGVDETISEALEFVEGSWPKVLEMQKAEWPALHYPEIPLGAPSEDSKLQKTPYQDSISEDFQRTDEELSAINAVNASNGEIVDNDPLGIEDADQV